MGKPIDLTGHRSGRLVALYAATTSNGLRGWVCQCDCGAVTSPIPTGNLRKADGSAGRSRSCGCARRESVAAVGRANRLTPEGYRKPSKAKPRKVAACTVCGRPLAGRSHKTRHRACKSTESARATKARAAATGLAGAAAELQRRLADGA